jgi:TonB-linked SusC/RagA family outer membrane protein
MTRIFSLFVVFMLSGVLAFSQNRVVTGTVTDNKGVAVTNASVVVVGTKLGASSDENGRYRIANVPPNATLKVTAYGITAKETALEGASSLNFTVTRTADDLKEVVVVGALGIKKSAKSSGTASGSVNNAQLTVGRPTNIAQALSGKISGLTINNNSSSVNGSPRIVIRGLRSITGDNQALIVLDGVAVPASTINFLNANDVERVDVLKGGQSATLFGSEGVNGAIVITTKKGVRKPEITLSNTLNAETLAYLPRTQHGFGSGSAYGSSNAENFHPSENQQYGDHYDGSIRPLGRQLADGSILLLPYSDRPNIRRKVWDVGQTRQTDISYRAASENTSFFTSYQNSITNGIVPGDKYERNVFRINAGNTYNKFNISFDANYSFDNAKRTDADYYFSALNSASWVPFTDFADWQGNKFADPKNYYNDYYNNPYWEKDNNRFNTRSNSFNSNFKVAYNYTKDFTIKAQVGIIQTNTNQTTKYNNYAYSGYSKTGAFSNYFNQDYDRFLTGLGRFIARSTPIVGGNGESQSTASRITGDVFATHKKPLGNFTLKTILGLQASVRRTKGISVSTNGIGVNGLFNLGNSLTGLYNGGNSESQTRKIGAYLDASLDYKNFIFFHGSARQDYTSIFSGPAIGYNSPNFSTFGGDVSLIVSDLIPSIKDRSSKVFDLIKVRASYNVNGNDNLGAYSLQQIYPNASGFPYSGLLGSTLGNTLYSPNLRPEKVKASDIGLELSLLKNKIVIEASVYKQRSSDQILNVAISPASGYTNYLLNAADVENKGYELDLKAQVYQSKSKDFEIRGNVNYSYNTNVVTQLYGTTGLKSFEYQAPDDRASLNATVGQGFPFLRTTAFKRDGAGKVIVNAADGWPERTDGRVDQGTTLPKHVIGLGFSVKWKQITFAANAEYRGGALVYHDIGTDMAFTGSSAISAIYNRESFVWPNSVTLDPSGKSIPNTNIAVDNYKAIYQGFGDAGFSRGFSGVGELFISSADFWKIRDMALTYDFPESLFRGKNLKGASFSTFARNLLTFLPKDNWYTDPELSNTNGNSQGINTTGNTPPTRQIGATLKLVF